MPCRSQDFQSRQHAEVPVSEALAGRSGWVAPIGVALLLFEKPRRSWSRAWSRAHGLSNRGVRVGEIANGRFRPLDPWYRIKNNVVVRRLSPNNRKIEVEKGKSTLFTSDMLQTMGFDLANVHLGTAERRDAIKRDLENRKRGWLTANARKASDATTQEYKDWKAN